MESLYHQTNRMLEEINPRFNALERSYGDAAESIEREIQVRIDQITR